MRSRDVRRHHAERIKRRVRERILTTWTSREIADDPTFVGRLATTPHPCSCWMCGHQRANHGPTRQEIRAEGEH